MHDITDDLQARLEDFAAKHPHQVEASFLMAEDAIAPLAGDPETVDRVYMTVSEILSRATDPSCGLMSNLETDGVLVIPRAPAEAGSVLIAGEVGLLGVVVMHDMEPVEVLNDWRSHKAA